MSNPVHAFGILLSRQCNALCGHCGSSSGPDRRDRMDSFLARRVVNEAADAGVRSLVISGGEPFLHRRLLHDTVDAGGRRSLQVAVCTNGWWGAGHVDGESWLASLREVGLTRVLLSTDRWHLGSVALDAVVGAAGIATRLGLDPSIAIPAGRNDWVALQLLSELSERTQAHVYTHPAHPVGRGASLPPSTLQHLPPKAGPCHLVGYLEVDVDGTLSVCPTSAEFPVTSPLRLGNVHTEPVTSLVDRYRQTPLYWLIANFGPVGVSRLAVVAGLVAPMPSAFRHDCLLCEALHGDRTLVNEIGSALGLPLADAVGDEQFARTVSAVERLLAMDTATVRS